MGRRYWSSTYHRALASLALAWKDANSAIEAQCQPEPIDSSALFFSHATTPRRSAATMRIYLFRHGRVSSIALKSQAPYRHVLLGISHFTNGRHNRLLLCWQPGRGFINVVNSFTGLLVQQSQKDIHGESRHTERSGIVTTTMYPWCSGVF